ncbi:hypothetical protein RYX36_017250 [Vicia faba]
MLIHILFSVWIPLFNGYFVALLYRDRVHVFILIHRVSRTILRLIATTKIVSSISALIQPFPFASETLTSNAKPPPSPLPFSDSLQWVTRTNFYGELVLSDVGKTIQICGWVALHRVRGGLTFLNLTDHTRIVQFELILRHVCH